MKRWLWTVGVALIVLPITPTLILVMLWLGVRQ